MIKKEGMLQKPMTMLCDVRKPCFLMLYFPKAMEQEILTKEQTLMNAFWALYAKFRESKN